MSLLRLAFAWQNASYFKTFSTTTFLYGAFFDAVTIALLSLPYALLSFPGSWKSKQIVKYVGKLYICLITIFILVLNTWDIAYFSYTQKRSSLSYFTHLLAGTETSSLAGEFLAEFWWLPIVFIALFYGLIRSFKSIQHYAPIDSWKSWVVYLFVLFGTFSLARGGFSLRPLSIIDATAMSSLEEAPLVLNTAFTVLKTSKFEDPQKVFYLNEKALKSYLPQTTWIQHKSLPERTNVVVIILESFGTVYSGPNSPMSFSPFLDSILDSGLFLDAAIANGRTSMDAVPSILAGIPSWQNESYILSTFCTNQIDALPSVLKKKGYDCSFFHGAKTGSMNFDDFTKAIGIDQYYGMEQYNGPEAFDGNWGIWDHAMFPYFAKTLSSFKEPFFSSFFSLSSHHPYLLPEQYKDKVKKGPEPLCATISYTDISLKLFFKKAAQQPWYKNTLFVLVADHVGPTRLAANQTLAMRYRIPIGFYHPKVNLKKSYQHQIQASRVYQQIDIFPTILDLLGFNNEAFTFGTSLFQPQQGKKLVYENGNLISFFRNNHSMDVLAWNPAYKGKSNADFLKHIRPIQATYQDYQHRLLENRCCKGR
jgi:phosphoglycerol transferase MdoB-like AlkP superfamily enzyme